MRVRTIRILFALAALKMAECALELKAAKRSEEVEAKPAKAKKAANSTTAS